MSTKKLDLMERSVGILDTLVSECPMPTDEELRKLLAIQGAMLNQMGISLMESASGQKRVERKINLILKVMHASRAATEAAARIRVKPTGGEEGMD